MLRLERLPDSEQQSILKKIKTDKNFRIQYCSHDFKMFWIYYFWNLMTHWIAPFHNNYYDWAQSEKNLCLIWYRWCAKSAIFWLIFIIWCIVYKKESFIIFLAFNKTDASWKLRNVITALKTNRKLTNDFWFLYEDENSRKKNLNKMPESKSVSKFITTNSIRVEAFSMDQNARWFVFYDDEWNFIRPSLVIADDVAVLKNSKNKDTVDKDFKFLTEELLWWVKWRIIFLLNAISEYCITELLKRQFKSNKDWIFDEKAIIEEWKITWPAKYVWTEEEAKIYNEWRAKSLKVESIESFKARWLKAFNTNYMNVPEIALWDPVFDLDLLESIVPKIPIRKHILTVNKKKFELFVYKECPIVSVWVDVSNGWGWDNSSITWTDDKWNLVFQWASNLIEPYELAYLIKSIHYNLKYAIYKNCLVIEKNNSWIAVIQELRHDKFLYRLIYRKRTEWKLEDTPTNQVWFATTASSKEMIKGELDKKIENRTLDLSFDEAYEFKRYVIDESWSYNAAPGSKDDRVISRWLCLMWLLYKKN